MTGYNLDMEGRDVFDRIIHVVYFMIFPKVA